MASVVECIEKLAATKMVTRAVADEALEFYKRRKAEWSREMSPASADAAAALETAKKMNDKAVENQIAIAADVSRWKTVEKRILEDPRGRNAALAGVLSKDSLIGDTRLNALKRDDPAHPILSDGNADYRSRVISDKLFGMLGPELEKFKAGIFKGKAQLLSDAKNFIEERFGVDTGNATAKAVSDGFNKVIEYGAARAKAAGKVFTELEDWRVFQHWTPERVARVSEAEYLKDYRAEINSGGLKLFDKETNRYATADRYDDILKKAYSDIKTEGTNDTPFSKHARTYEFQPGQAGADSWLKLQAKYGVGNEVMGAVASHIEHMSRTIALHETFGAHPDAVFAAALRLVKDDPSVPVKGFGFLQSERTLKLTYDMISGRGNPVANETFARIMAGARDVVGMASLRNLPITIIPGDALMTQLATSFNGMSGFNVLSHVFSGMTKDVAQHLQIASHSSMDFINNFVRRYEDQINVSGLARKVSRGVVKATGAELWTTNGRLGFQVSYLNQMAAMRDVAFAKLDPQFREHFLANAGFTAADWDKIRAPDPFVAPNGAKYLDLNKIEGPVGERLMAAIKEQGSYAFHQPDARTQAIMGQGATRGTIPGEAWRSFGQYKQFTMERMTTHLMRVLVDGPIENRIARGAAFTILSMAAGAVSLQAAAVANGKDPMDMASPKFWLEAFARGGAGSIYGDILGAAVHGDRGGLNMVAQMAGPIPGFVGDTAQLAFGPGRRAIDESGKPSKKTEAGDLTAFGRRWTPQTWYTKLAVDRLIWDKLQILVDPNYRASFRHVEDRAKKQGAGFWWGPGDERPERAPDLSTAFGHH